MITYTTTPADRRPLPPNWRSEPRHLGYRAEDYAKPYAKFFRDEALPMQPHVQEALLYGMSPTEWAYDVKEAARRLERPGYHAMETGWTRTENGVVQINVLTQMSGVRAEMFDWWMGWHSRETARYKLWNPQAHLFAALGEDRADDRILTDRQRYVHNVSYIDEYIGGTVVQAALHFCDPAELGFSDRPGHTVLFGVGSSPQAPVISAPALHYIRPTDDGCEMRSRFWFGDAPGFIDLPPEALDGSRTARVLSNKVVQAAVTPLLPRLGRRQFGIEDSFGHAMVVHCATEMNHLASFLPQLYEEFKDTP